MDLVVRLLQEDVNVTELRSFDEPMVLLVLMKEREEGGDVLVELRGDVFDDFCARPMGFASSSLCDFQTVADVMSVPFRATERSPAGSVRRRRRVHAGRDEATLSTCRRAFGHWVFASGAAAPNSGKAPVDTERLTGDPHRLGTEQPLDHTATSSGFPMRLSGCIAVEALSAVRST